MGQSERIVLCDLVRLNSYPRFGRLGGGEACGCPIRVVALAFVRDAHRPQPHVTVPPDAIVQSHSYDLATEYIRDSRINEEGFTIVIPEKFGDDAHFRIGVNPEE